MEIETYQENENYIQELNKKKSSRLLSDKRCSYASVIAGANTSRNIDLSLT
jgi:hypothetical protein